MVEVLGHIICTFSRIFAKTSSPIFVGNEDSKKPWSMTFGNENVQFCELLNIEQTVLMRPFYWEEYVKNASKLCLLYRHAVWKRSGFLNRSFKSAAWTQVFFPSSVGLLLSCLRSRVGEIVTRKWIIRKGWQQDVMFPFSLSVKILFQSWSPSGSAEGSYSYRP